MMVLFTIILYTKLNKYNLFSIRTKSDIFTTYVNSNLIGHNHFVAGGANSLEETERQIKENNVMTY